MGNYYRVKIQKDTSILFPKYCVICGKVCGDKTIKIAGSYGGSFWHWKGTFKSAPKLIIPGHLECNNVFKKKSLYGEILTLTFSIIPVGIFSYIRWEIDILTILLFVVCAFLFGKIIDRFYYQEPIMFSKDDNKMSFLFKDRNYANKFAEINREILYKEVILDSGEAVKRVKW